MSDLLELYEPEGAFESIEAHLAGAQQFLQPPVRQRRIVPFEPAIYADAVVVVGYACRFRHQIQRTNHKPTNSARMESSAEPAI